VLRFGKGWVLIQVWAMDKRRIGRGWGFTVTPQNQKQTHVLLLQQTSFVVVVSDSGIKVKTSSKRETPPCPGFPRRKNRKKKMKK